MPWIGLQCVIVLFPGHTHLLFNVDFVLVLTGDNCYCFISTVNDTPFMYREVFPLVRFVIISLTKMHCCLNLIFLETLLMS